MQYFFDGCDDDEEQGCGKLPLPRRSAGSACVEVLKKDTGAGT